MMVHSRYYHTFLFECAYSIKQRVYYLVQYSLSYQLIDFDVLYSIKSHVYLSSL